MSADRRRLDLQRERIGFRRRQRKQESSKGSAHYFEDYFAEQTRVVPEATFEITSSDGTWHLMSYEVVIEQIKNTTGIEARKIAQTIRDIDFRNGDLGHYLRFLGAGLAESYAKETTRIARGRTARRRGES